MALVVSDEDYHWYRQDSDGLWSHKQGTFPVTRNDDSGDPIIDPKLADRGEYTEFLGYYAVTPWNGMFTDSETVYCYYFGEIYTYDYLMSILSSQQSSQHTTSSWVVKVESA